MTIQELIEELQSFDNMKDKVSIDLELGVLVIGERAGEIWL